MLFYSRSCWQQNWAQFVLYINSDCMYNGRQPSYRDNCNCTAVTSGPTSFRSILTHYFLYKYIVWSHIFIALLSSMFSLTLLIVCTISVVPEQWLSIKRTCKKMFARLYGIYYYKIYIVYYHQFFLEKIVNVSTKKSIYKWKRLILRFRSWRNFSWTCVKHSYFKNILLLWGYLIYFHNRAWT